MATGWNPRDSADIQSEINEVTKEINVVEAQVRKAEAAAEQAVQHRNAVSATLRELAKKVKQPDLNEQERAELVAEQQRCVADLTAAEKDLERLRKEKEQLRKEKEQLRKEKEQLRKKEEQLREEKLLQDGHSRRAGTAAGQGSGSTATGGGSNLMAWAVGVPLVMLALAVDRGVSILDDGTQSLKAFIARNDVALAASYKGIRGVGVVASVGLGVAAAVGACLKRMRVRPGRPRLLRPGPRKQQLAPCKQLAPASAVESDGGLAREVLPAGTSAAGQVDR